MLTPIKEDFLNAIQCVKNVHIRSYSGPHFPVFRLNTERYGVSPYSVRMRENANQNKYECGHFLRSDALLGARIQ